MENHVSENICVVHRSQRTRNSMSTADLKERFINLGSKMIEVMQEHAETKSDENQKADTLACVRINNERIAVFQNYHANPYIPEYIKFINVVKSFVELTKQFGKSAPFSLEKFSLDHYLGDVEGEPFPTHVFLHSGPTAQKANACAQTIVVDEEEMRRLSAEFPDVERQFDQETMKDWDPELPIYLIVPAGTQITPCKQVNGVSIPYIWYNPIRSPIISGGIDADGNVHLAENVSQDGQLAQILRQVSGIFPRSNPQRFY